MTLWPHFLLFPPFRAPILKPNLNQIFEYVNFKNDFLIAYKEKRYEFVNQWAYEALLNSWWIYRYRILIRTHEEVVQEIIYESRHELDQTLYTSHSCLPSSLEPRLDKSRVWLVKNNQIGMRAQEAIPQESYSIYLFYLITPFRLK